MSGDDCDSPGYAPGLSDKERDFQRLYGPWAAWDLEEARAVFDTTGLVWWIAGGYAVEAFTGVVREHDDIDVSIFRRDVPRLIEALSGRYHTWAAGAPGLVPLTNAQMPVPEQADQVWLRAHALAPWRADVLVNPDRDGDWVSRRDPTFSAPLETVTWCRDGIRYLNAEIALAFKAKLLRPKDQCDFDAAWPLLKPSARRWLVDYLERKEAEHPWLSQSRLATTLEEP
ncbi:MAG: nucleotidyltransferase domain-containing protein [Nocardioidaceae bacterium]